MDPKNLVYQLGNWWRLFGPLIRNQRNHLILTNRVIKYDWERKFSFDRTSTSGIMINCDLVVKLHDKNIQVIKNRFDLVR